MELKFKSNYLKDSDWGNLESEGLIKGYASVFGNKDSDGDIISQGAYTKTLQENKDRIAFLWQHRMDQPIGKAREIEQDDIGLFIEAKISDSSLGRDVKTMLMEGIVKEFSVGFIPIKEELIKDINFIKEIKLFEFSLVTLAANDQARVTEYKSSDMDVLVDEFDRLAFLTRKLNDPRMLEFEFLKLKNIITHLNKNESVEPTHESKEVEGILKALETFKV